MTEFIKALLFVVVGEMGDKTQLMTIAISAESHNPLFILMGTTVGMLDAD
ncbi:TMEM165/GDT1 family protein [Clostridium saccharoperbutylacetonicum]